MAEVELAKQEARAGRSAATREKSVSRWPCVIVYELSLDPADAVVVLGIFHSARMSGMFDQLPDEWMHEFSRQGAQIGAETVRVADRSF